MSTETSSVLGCAETFKFDDTTDLINGRECFEFWVCSRENMKPGLSRNRKIRDSFGFIFIAPKLSGQGPNSEWTLIEVTYYLTPEVQIEAVFNHRSIKSQILTSVSKQILKHRWRPGQWVINGAASTPTGAQVYSETSLLLDFATTHGCMSMLVVGETWGHPISSSTTTAMSSSEWCRQHRDGERVGEQCLLRPTWHFGDPQMLNWSGLYPKEDAHPEWGVIG